MIPLPPGFITAGYQPAVKVILSVLILVSAVLFGAGLMYDHEEAKIADLKRTQAEAKAKAADAALERLQAAQALSNGLETGLVLFDQALQKQAQEHAREIKRLTTGRPCLNAGTVRLLNQPSPGIRAPAVPAPVGQPSSADATARPDPDDGQEASDTDVAGWIDVAKRQYETCRGRLQALIDWWME